MMTCFYEPGQIKAKGLIFLQR